MKNEETGLKNDDPSSIFSGDNGMDEEAAP
jgi:hypothetical protein